MVAKLAVVCAVDGCDRPRKVKGFCGAHYSRLCRLGTTGPAEIQEHRRGALCSLEGCGRKHYGKGLCDMHYTRMRLKGDPGPVVSWYERSDLTYSSAHKRVSVAKGPASSHSCWHCGQQAGHWAYDWKDPNELVGHNGKQQGLAYSLNPDHYFPLCTPCHGAFDAEHRRAA